MRTASSLATTAAAAAHHRLAIQFYRASFSTINNHYFFIVKAQHFVLLTESTGSIAIDLSASAMTPVDTPLSLMTAISIQPFSDFRATSRDRARDHKRSKKYFGFRHIKQGDLATSPNQQTYHVPTCSLHRKVDNCKAYRSYDADFRDTSPTAKLTKRQAYTEAQRWPRPPAYHRSTPKNLERRKAKKASKKATRKELLVEEWREEVEELNYLDKFLKDKDEWELERDCGIDFVECPYSTLVRERGSEDILEERKRRMQQEAQQVDVQSEKDSDEGYVSEEAEKEEAIGAWKDQLNCWTRTVDAWNCDPWDGDWGPTPKVTFEDWFEEDDSENYTFADWDVVSIASEAASEAWTEVDDDCSSAIW